MSDPEMFIAAMRKAPSAVSIVATNGAMGPYGATVSAVCSLSAEPPSVLICLNRKSRILELVEEHGTFSVNYLAQGHQDLVFAFAGKPGTEPLRVFDPEYWDQDAEHALPVLRGAAASFTCLHIQTIPFGSHRILIGKVETARNSANPPLLYCDGAVHQLSDPAP